MLGYLRLKTFFKLVIELGILLLVDYLQLQSMMEKVVDINGSIYVISKKCILKIQTRMNFHASVDLFIQSYVHVNNIVMFCYIYKERVLNISDRAYIDLSRHFVNVT